MPAYSIYFVPDEPWPVGGKASVAIQRGCLAVNGIAAVAGYIGASPAKVQTVKGEQLDPHARAWARRKFSTLNGFLPCMEGLDRDVERAGRFFAVME